MDSTPPSSKKMKTKGVKRGGRLESWFSGESEKIDKYLHETSSKLINTPISYPSTGLKIKSLWK